MERVYGSEWQVEEKVKRKEMVSPEARYIFVYETADSDANQMSESVIRRGSRNVHASDKETIVGFVHFRFTLEEEVPVLYVYELQLEPLVQGKGLGNFLMQLIELIACEVINFSLLFYNIVFIYRMDHVIMSLYELMWDTCCLLNTTHVFLIFVKIKCVNLYMCLDVDC